MTFTEIAAEVTADLELTSTTAIARVGRKVNIRYKQLVSSLGLKTSKQASVTVSPVVGSTEITVPNFIKVTRVADVTDTSAVEVLEEVSWDELRETLASSSDSAEKWAVKRIASTFVVLAFDVAFATAAPDFRVDGYEITGTISGNSAPAFPEDFHDILVWGVKADELLKMEKKAEAQYCEAEFKRRTSELRLFLAQSLYNENRRQSGQ